MCNEVSHSVECCCILDSNGLNAGSHVDPTFYAVVAGIDVRRTGLNLTTGHESEDILPIICVPERTYSHGEGFGREYGRKMKPIFA